MDIRRAARAVDAPAPRREPTRIEQVGRVREDPYAWMKDDGWQQVLREPSKLRDDVRAHLDAENAYQEALLAPLAPLQERLFGELRGRIKEDDSSVPAPHGPWAYYARYREGGQYPVFARMPRGAAEAALAAGQPRGGGPEEQVLFDGDAASLGPDGEAKKFFSIGAVRWSPDHARIAVSTDEVGSEYYRVRFRDLDRDQWHEDTLESTSGQPVWANDARTLFYVVRDDHQRPRWVKRHVLGTDPDTDPVIYEETDPAFFLRLGRTQSGAYIVIEAAGHTSGEVRLVSADRPQEAPVLVAPRRPLEEYSVEHRGDWLYIRTNAGDATDFKIVRAPLATPGREHWQDWIPHQPGRYILDLTAYRDHLVRLERADALPRLVVSDYDGNEHTVSMQEQAYALGLLSGHEFDTTTTRFVYQSPSTPAQTYAYDLATRQRALLKTAEVPSGHDPSHYEVERFFAASHDGAQVPVTVLRLRQTPKDGAAPLLLYGYGSYGITIDASFNTNVLSLVDRGVVYAIAHVRGGSAKGYGWYLDGKLDKKMNTFRDFVAVGRELVRRGYTGEGRVVAHGGSAGGLLVGAAVNLDPALFGGVIGEVPFVDVLNTISDESLPLTPPEWPEWGNPITDPEAYDQIAAYSPYDNVHAGPYPPIFATGGLTDFRVTYWEPAKWIARLRAEAEGGPFLLRMKMEAGHGGSAARLERLKERAEVYGFALALWGLEDAAPIRHR